MNPTAYFEKYIFLKELAVLPFVEKIILYGSRARMDNTKKSDIDLAIECPQATDKQWVFEILKIIENADTLLKIDCVRFDELKDGTKFKNEILNDGIILYQKEKL